MNCPRGPRTGLGAKAHLGAKASRQTQLTTPFRTCASRPRSQVDSAGCGARILSIAVRPHGRRPDDMHFRLHHGGRRTRRPAALTTVAPKWQPGDAIPLGLRSPTVGALRRPRDSMIRRFMRYRPHSRSAAAVTRRQTHRDGRNGLDAFLSALTSVGRMLHAPVERAVTSTQRGRTHGYFPPAPSR